MFNLFEPKLDKVLGQFNQLNNNLERIINVRLKKITARQRLIERQKAEIMADDAVAMRAKTVQKNIQKLIEV